MGKYEHSVTAICEEEKAVELLCRKSIAILLSCLICMSAWAGGMPVVAPEEVGLSSERLDRLTRAMEKGVEAGHFAGAVAAIARKGKIAYFETYGYQDQEAGVPMDKDTIFRLASMTKAVTGVAVMILYEEGHFFLNDPVARFLPAFQDVQVAVNGESYSGKQAKGKKKSSGKAKEDVTAANQEKDLKTVPANRPITIRDLLRHTSGIASPGAGIYEEGMNLGEMIDRLAKVPLEFHPGTQWRYGLSTDVLARLVEVVSGMSFDDFIEERIFVPLGMKDTAFYLPKEKHSRLVKMYAADSKKQKKSGKSPAGDTYLSPPVILMGGTGLVSTTMDYLRFCQMLLNNGALEGKRILGRKSVELMRANHMGDVPTGYPNAKLGYQQGFGLTFGVKPGPGETGELGSEGSYYWGGAYGTTFWIDPVEELTGVFMVNGFKYDKNSYTNYAGMVELFTYQAIID
jgi:CubicO group peptidase (beta-lactamase class C family)